MEKYQEWGFLSPKIRRVMKITLVFTLLCLMHISANTYAQTTQLSVDVRNGTFYDVVKQIEKQSEYLFFYNSKEIPNDLPVSLLETNANISVILDEVAKRHNLSYKINDRHIFFTKNAVSQQGKRISGIVKDENGEPVIGANVIEKGTTNGVVTDIDGKYNLVVSQGSTLFISYIGYNNQEIKIGKNEVINIVLREDAKALDEVVVVGYGSVKKGNLTTAVTSVKSDALANRPVQTVADALQGQVPGLSIVQSGRPGSASSMQLRGATSLNETGSPLLLVDGVPGEFNYLNVDDIESITVLKDAASAAIYGSRAAHGVILLTTKRGGIGKPTFRYNGSVGVNTPTDMVRPA